MRPLRTVFLVAALVCAATAASRTVWDGVYSTGQADRGKTVYLAECSRCHGETLLGGETAPAVAGDDYLDKLNGKTVGSLVELIRTTMPTDGPGYLTRRQSTDIVAYLLSANKVPSGDADLSSTLSRLNEIEFGPKP